MDRPEAKPHDDVVIFLRDVRSSTSRGQVGLKHLLNQRSEAAARFQSRMASWNGNGSAAEVIEEVVARDDELNAAIEELRQQIESLRRASALLERERSKYVDLFLQAPDAYIVTDLKGVTQEANVAAGALFSAEPAFLAGRPLISFVARQDTRAFRELLLELESGGGRPGARTLTLRMRPRGQSVFAASAHVGVVRSASDKPLALRWVVRRLDAREQQEARSLADAELARMIAHDLRGPLSTILGCTHILRHRAQEPAERNKAIDWIEAGAATQNAMLDDLAELGEAYETADSSQGDSPTGELVDVAERLRAVVDALPPTAGAERLMLFAERLPNNVGADRGLRVLAKRARVDRLLELLLKRTLAGTPVAGQIQVIVKLEAQQVIVDLSAPQEAAAPSGWAVRMATASRIAQMFGGRLVLNDRALSARLCLPSAAGS